MTACVDEDRVASYFAGALREAEVDAIEAHVDGCAACRELLDACALDSDAGDNAGDASDLALGEAARAAPTAQLKKRATADPAREAPRAFRIDQLVGERYRIVRFIAAGGMGEVYEVDDLELRERVALKTMRVELTDAPQAIERFRREVQLARKITHPNVCRIFDVAKHQEPSGELTVFMTMALLGGESLAKRLRRDGPLAIADALPLARDLAAALDAAHAAGVLHRDFKSDNVQLVPDGDLARAVVTDFGLARTTAGDRMLTGSNGFVGTPAYMAPEQVENTALTPATDVYAFGIVLFEMVTGELPFVDASPLAVAARRLLERPRSIHDVRPDLPAVWDAVVARCLELEPRRRFASAGAALAVLDGATPRARSRRRMLAWLGVGLGAAAIATGATLLATRTRAQPDAAADPGALAIPRVRATLLLTPTAGGDAGLDALIDDALAGELAARHALVATGDDARFTDAHWRIAPRVRRDGDRVTLTITATDVHDGAAVGEAEVSGPIATLPELIAHATRALVATAHLPADEPAPAPAAHVPPARLPKRDDARDHYGAALARVRAYDTRGARDELVATIAAEPEFPWARLALARADAALGYDVRAKTEAAAALAMLPADADDATRWQFRADAAAASRDWDSAITACQQRVALDPDDPARVVELAAIAVDARRHDVLEPALARLRALRPGDPRVDLFAAFASEDNYAVQLDAAKRAVATAERVGATELAARAQLFVGHASMQRLDLGAALAADHAAADAFTVTGDRVQLARAWRNEAGMLQLRGQTEAARERYEAARVAYTALDTPDAMVEVLGELSALARATGDLDRARSLHQDGVALGEAAGGHRASSASMVNLAENLLEGGNLAGARALFMQALSLRKVGPRKNWILTLSHVAEVDGELADPAQPARTRLDEAIAAAATLQAPLVELELARLAATMRLADGDLDGSLALSRPALATAQRAGIDASSYATLVVSALARGPTTTGDDATAAAAALAIVTAAADHAENPSARIAAGAALTEWEVRRTAVTTRLAWLRDAVAAADHAGQIRRALGLALLLGDLGLHVHDPHARAALDALATRAHGLGFERIAHRATAIAAR